MCSGRSKRLTWLSDPTYVARNLQFPPWVLLFPLLPTPQGGCADSQREWDPQLCTLLHVQPGGARGSVFSLETTAAHCERPRARRRTYWSGQLWCGYGDAGVVKFHPTAQVKVTDFHWRHLRRETESRGHRYEKPEAPGDQYKQRGTWAYGHHTSAWLSTSLYASPGVE